MRPDEGNYTLPPEPPPEWADWRRAENEPPPEPYYPAAPPERAFAWEHMTYRPGESYIRDPRAYGPDLNEMAPPPQPLRQSQQAYMDERAAFEFGNNASPSTQAYLPTPLAPEPFYEQIKNLRLADTWPWRDVTAEYTAPRNAFENSVGGYYSPIRNRVWIQDTSAAAAARYPPEQQSIVNDARRNWEQNDILPHEYGHAYSIQNARDPRFTAETAWAWLNTPSSAYPEGEFLPLLRDPIKNFMAIQHNPRVNLAEAYANMAELYYRDPNAVPPVWRNVIERMYAPPVPMMTATRTEQPRQEVRMIPAPAAPLGPPRPTWHDWGSDRRKG
jgi:hypothetical protein